MKTSLIFIGEVYKKEKNGEDVRLGFHALKYNPRIGLYKSLYGTKYTYGVGKDSDSSKYIKEDSLIPYDSFAKKGDLFTSNKEIENNCNQKIEKLVRRRCIKLYSYNYTFDDILDIHERGNITIDEKVEELLKNKLCYMKDIIGKDNKDCSLYQTCSECIYEQLYKTGKKEFKPYSLEKENSKVLVK